MKPNTTKVSPHVTEAEHRLEAALAALSDSPDMPITRARAIAATATSIFQALLIETKLAAIKQEQQ